MSKGTIQGNPGITHANVTVVIADDNEWGLGPGAVLDFGPDDSNNPMDDFFHLHEGDYIEFTITGNNSDHDGTCNSIKKIQSKGTVSEVSADGKGRLIVTVATPNNYEVDQNANLAFNNPSGLTLNQNDYVEFDNLKKDSEGKMICDVTRKIESRGVVREVYAGGQGRLMVMAVISNTLGVARNTDLTFNNNSGEPLVMDDNVEFINLAAAPTPGSLAICDAVSKI